MVFRWDPCGIFCILLTYAAIAYADYVFVCWLVLPSMNESIWGFVHIAAFNVLLCFLATAHGRAMFCDPGIVPFARMNLDFSDMSSHNDKLSDSDSDQRRPSFVGDDWTICGRCEAYRPPRAHHCRICKRCVRKMDHHCPWINNCVGEFNQKYFLQFLIFVGISSLYALALVVYSWVSPCHDCFVNEYVKHAKVLHSIFVTVECALFALFVIAVACDQFQAIFTDETAVEQVQRRCPSRPGRSKMALLRDVCGHGTFMVWLLPCHSLPNSRDYVTIPTYYSA